MTEGWARHLGGKTVSVQSAGIEAHGKNPRAIAVMAEAGNWIVNRTKPWYEARVTEDVP